MPFTSGVSRMMSLICRTTASVRSSWSPAAEGDDCLVADVLVGMKPEGIRDIWKPVRPIRPT